MAFIRAFGSYLPSRVVDNAELAALVGAEPNWILKATGIEQRRYADPSETVATLGSRAAQDCLDAAGLSAADIGLVLVSCGSNERRFPGPATEIASNLGMSGTPAIDLPLASAGSLFALSMAAGLSSTYRHILVIGTEIMSRAIACEPAGRDTAILFGDGAGACLVSADTGCGRIVDSIIRSDGEFAGALRLELNSTVYMEGRTIILQATRKIPRAILELLERNGRKSDEIGTYLMHQANLNLITRVAAALVVPESRFFRSIERYGNTSSASLLIAASEWWHTNGRKLSAPVLLTAFGAGLNWGAVLIDSYTE